jgi:hypothetical protein
MKDESKSLPEAGLENPTCPNQIDYWALLILAMG